MLISFKTEAHKLCNSWQHLNRDKIIKRMNIITKKLYKLIINIQEMISRPISRSTYIQRLKFANRTHKLITKLRKQEARIRNRNIDRQIRTLNMHNMRKRLKRLQGNLLNSIQTDIENSSNKTEPTTSRPISTRSHTNHKHKIKIPNTRV